MIHRHKDSVAGSSLVVVIGCDTFPPDINGAARFAERLAGGLSRDGHIVHVIAPSTNSRYGTYREIHDGVPIIVHRLKSYRLPQQQSLRFASPIGLRRSIRNLLSKIRPDAVHIQSHLWVGRFLSKEALRQNLRLVATNHLMPENLVRNSLLIPRILEPVARFFFWRDTYRVLKRAETVTTPTKKAAEILISHTPIRNVLAISCGINANQFASASEVASANRRILYVGRLDYEKRVNILIEAFSLLPKDLDLSLELVGDGNERQSLEAWAGELGVADRTIFRGHITDAELPSAYARSTVFVMPSIAELQSIATLEAMASGRPIIAANAAALPHLVHDGENGFLFEPNAAEDLAAKLERLFRLSDGELKLLGQASLHLIQSHDIAQTISRFEQIYRGKALEVSPTDDNLGTYTLSIDLTPAHISAIAAARETARKWLASAERSASGVLERLDDATGDVAEKFTTIGFDVLLRSKKASKVVERSIRRTLERFRSGDQ